MKGILRLIVLKTVVAIALFRVVSVPLQAAAQPAKASQHSKLIADYTPPKKSDPPQNPTPDAIRYVPPTTNPPSGGDVGTIRGLCAATADKPALRALVPESEGKSLLGETVKMASGQTISAHPTFWFDSPYSSQDNLAVEFVLQDRDSNDIYRTEVPLPPKPGVISISVPATKPPLQPQQWYEWTLQVKCKGEVGNDKNEIVHGWIHRTTLNPTLMQQLKGADLHHQAVLYAENSIWFDAVTTLGNALKAKPNDPGLKQDWVTLLREGGLQERASSPIVKP